MIFKYKKSVKMWSCIKLAEVTSGIGMPYLYIYINITFIYKKPETKPKNNNNKKKLMETCKK